VAGEVSIVLVGLAVLSVLVGVLPLSWLVQAAGLATVLSLAQSNPIADLVAATVLALATGIALGWAPLGQRLTQLKAWASRLGWVERQLHLDQASDPYVIIGGILLTLGRLSAALLDQTLGRLVRAD
jgi:hypothetical protein